VDTLYEYDPETDSWLEKAHMNMPRFEHAAISFNGKIYVFGGAQWNGGPVYLCSSEVYDPETDSWSNIASMPIPLARMGAATDGRYIYLIGGTNGDWWYDQLPIVLRYDPENNVWEDLSNTMFELITSKSAAPACFISSFGIYSVTGLVGEYSSGDLELLPIASAPVIVSTSPSDSEIGVFVNTTISATFSKAMDASSINTSTFIVKDEDGNIISGSVNYDEDTMTAKFTPSSPFEYGLTYTVTIVGGEDGVKDITGTPMEEDYSWSFTTFIPGDRNLDGEITIDEIQCAINQFLGICPVSSYCDLNRDGVVSIDEVQRIITIYLQI